MTDRFRLLLHNISTRLSEKDLKSLISLCNVCESRRADIKDGMNLFENLMQRDVINNDEKVDKLKDLLKSLEPKRRDLVRLVNEYQGLQATEEDDCSEIVSIRHSASTAEVDHTQPCCSIHWSCVNASFYKVHVVYVVLILIFVIAIIICCVLWYGNVPRISKHLDADEDLKNAGIYIIIAIVFVCFPVSIFCVCCGRRYYQRNKTPALTPLENVPAEVNESVAVGMEQYSASILQDNTGYTVNDCIGNYSGANGVSLDNDEEPIIAMQESDS